MSRKSIIILLEVTISCYCYCSSYRFFDSRYSFGKTPVELNKYITLLRKNNLFSLNPFDFSYEVLNLFFLKLGYELE